MRSVLAACCIGGLAALPIEAQTATLGLHAAAVTDRASGVTLVVPARGLGVGARAEVAYGRVALEGSALRVSITRHTPLGLLSPNPASPVAAAESWRLVQLALDARFSLISGLAAELSARRRLLNPDFDGEEVGFVVAGLSARVPLSSLGQVRGRLGYIPVARFSGSGDARSGGEAELGVSFGLAARLRAEARYQFQRIDRVISLVSGETLTSRLELDVAQFGFALLLGRAR